MMSSEPRGGAADYHGYHRPHHYYPPYAGGSTHHPNPYYPPAPRGPPAPRYDDDIPRQPVPHYPRQQQHPYPTSLHGGRRDLPPPSEDSGHRGGRSGADGDRSGDDGIRHASGSWAERGPGGTLALQSPEMPSPPNGKEETPDASSGDGAGGAGGGRNEGSPDSFDKSSSADTGSSLKHVFSTAPRPSANGGNGKAKEELPRPTTLFSPTPEKHRSSSRGCPRQYERYEEPRASGRYEEGEEDRRMPSPEDYDRRPPRGGYDDIDRHHAQQPPHETPVVSSGNHHPPRREREPLGDITPPNVPNSAACDGGGNGVDWRYEESRKKPPMTAREACNTPGGAEAMTVTTTPAIAVSRVGRTKRRTPSPYAGMMPGQPPIHRSHPVSYDGYPLTAASHESYHRRYDHHHDGRHPRHYHLSPSPLYHSPDAARLHPRHHPDPRPSASRSLHERGGISPEEGHHHHHLDKENALPSHYPLRPSPVQGVGGYYTPHSVPPHRRRHDPDDGYADDRAHRPPSTRGGGSAAHRDLPYGHHDPHQDEYQGYGRDGMAAVGRTPPGRGSRSPPGGGGGGVNMGGIYATPIIARTRSGGAEPSPGGKAAASVLIDRLGQDTRYRYDDDNNARRLWAEEPPRETEARPTAPSHCELGPKKRKRGEAAKKEKKPKRKKMYSDFIGVTYNKTHAKFQACITHYRKQHYLGRYKLAVDAAKAYDESARLLKGNGWKVNFGCPEEYERAKKRELERLEIKLRDEAEANGDEAGGRSLRGTSSKPEVPKGVPKSVREAMGMMTAASVPPPATVAVTGDAPSAARSALLPSSGSDQRTSQSDDQTANATSFAVTPSPVQLQQPQEEPSPISSPRSSIRTHALTPIPQRPRHLPKNKGDNNSSAATGTSVKNGGTLWTPSPNPPLSKRTNDGNDADAESRRQDRGDNKTQDGGQLPVPEVVQCRTVSRESSASSLKATAAVSSSEENGRDGLESEKGMKNSCTGQVTEKATEASGFSPEPTGAARRVSTDRPQQEDKPPNKNSSVSDGTEEKSKGDEKEEDTPLNKKGDGGGGNSSARKGGAQKNGRPVMQNGTLAAASALMTLIGGN